MKKILYIKNFPGKQVDFFLRLHRHLPDRICGGSAIGACFYRKDGCPINAQNDYVEKLKQDPMFVKKEQEVERAVEDGKKLFKEVSKK